MNAFVSLEKTDDFHFHDVEKNADIDRNMKIYRDYLNKVPEKELKLQPYKSTGFFQKQ
ncbi:hypothetical protein [Chryseobacterium caseinilyticum]|uniref:Uncharacterized protein n=1 Tax=Chryseobacterium caseinilyticum TaxID=2771428 RepID=A0ABR8ZH61_9FLAO|nr:hypothetical protein [Chryseobacterium caseinilyticum]MBD8084552.1 hypothetical protein [Chryseobacterium caseinilyticum]